MQTPAILESRAVLCRVGTVEVPAHFGDPASEYRAALTGVGLHDRSYRGLIQVKGNDRLSWLQNLASNDVSLPAGRTAYSYFCTVQGRILFDAHVLIHPNSVWLDVDTRQIDDAATHLEKYHISEDVRMVTCTGGFARLATIGRGQHPLLESSEGGTPPSFRQVEIGGAACWAFHSGFAGLPGTELIVPADAAPEVWRHLAENDRVTPIGLDAVQALRIEGGVPWAPEELGGDALPAETGQLDRTVSFTKGCYLGQEVVERMRARGAVGRHLVGLRAVEGTNVAPDAELLLEGKPVGRVTSRAGSPRHGEIAMAYLRATVAHSGSRLLTRGPETEADVEVVPLPFAAPPTGA